jgi:hypothetical protein
MTVINSELNDNCSDLCFNIANIILKASENVFEMGEKLVAEKLLDLANNAFEIAVSVKSEKSGQ